MDEGICDAEAFRAFLVSLSSYVCGHVSGMCAGMCASVGPMLLACNGLTGPLVISWEKIPPVLAKRETKVPIPLIFHFRLTLGRKHC